ncbi:ABC transporter ATP-binding protein [Actinoplanes couchii]|uniref:ABC transporter n=1 Tax=Actinoplanes couchii TaxID=403638 RepID=A0ABQ3XM99_9ACTN|nr:ABC transporter ATP-binding protein [Actinoplanes couchii]MDR6321535.1 putative ABC transport system ATP-binding protein [Actinoplanes couchii]GID59631.1 ABC transporter [Actinoplanes couchii]
MTTFAVRLDAVTRRYGRVTALDTVSAGFRRGTFTAVMGPSGSGKSTFLNCATGLDRPTSGRVWLGDTDLAGRSENETTVLRRDRIGFVFQSYQLLDALTVADNVLLPVRLAGRRPDPARLAEVLAAVGLTGLGERRPAELSGGQRQRVAIARALVVRPDLICADEPTGALDSRSGHRILELLRALVDDRGQTVLMVTHDPVAAAFADTVVFLADGRLAGELPRPSADRVAERMTSLGEP